MRDIGQRFLHQLTFSCPFLATVKNLLWREPITNIAKILSVSITEELWNYVTCNVSVSVPWYSALQSLTQAQKNIFLFTFFWNYTKFNQQYYFATFFFPQLCPNWVSPLIYKHTWKFFSIGKWMVLHNLIFIFLCFQGNHFFWKLCMDLYNL